MADGTYDAGLVIHEARFTYPRYGLTALVDLGEWWEGDTGLPIPLGAILAKRGTVDPAAAAEWIRASVRQAWADPAASREYVLAHAQEMEPTWSTSTSRCTSTSSPRTSAPRATPRSTPCSAAADRRRAGPPQISSSRATAWTS